MALPALLWWVALEVVSIFVTHMLQPRKGKPQPRGASEDTVPANDPSRPIPVVFGTVKLSSPTVLWYGNRSAELFTNSYGSGYHYRATMDLALCHGPIDSIEKIEFEHNPAGWVTTGVDGGSPIGWRDVRITERMMFGGDSENGGVGGDVRFYYGSAAQIRDPNLISLVSANYPGMARVAHLVLRDGSSGFWYGNSAQLPGIAVVVSRCPNPFHGMGGWTDGREKWQGGSSMTAGGVAVSDSMVDANPACMLYEILTDTTWGLGIDPATIDATSFIAAANTLYTERFGLSMLLEQATEATEVIREILRHIDAGLSSDPTTGKLTLKLVRADYSVGSLPVLDQASVESVELSRGSWSETFNVAKVVFTSRVDNWTQRVVQWQNLASQQVMAESIATQVEFRGVSSVAVANVICARVLRVGSYPFARLKLRVNRKAWALRPVDVFVLNWPALGIAGMVVRVTKPVGGELESGMMTVEGVEDVFAFSGTGYGQPPGSGWVDSTLPPAAIATQRLIEVPYQICGGEFRQAQLLAEKPDATAVGFEVWSDTAGGTALALTNVVDEFTPTGVLSNDLDSVYVTSTPGDPDPILSAILEGFVVDTITGVEKLQSVSSVDLYRGVNLLLIDNELIAFRSVAGVGSTRTIQGVLRGVLDTCPARHSAGARVWFFTAAVRAVVNPVGSGTAAPPGEGTAPPGEELLANGYSTDVTVTAKGLPFNVWKTLPIASATSASLELASRALRPYPPGFGPAGPGNEGIYTHAVDVVMQWVHRSKALAASQNLLWDQIAESTALESGTTYRIEVWVGTIGVDFSTCTLKRSVSLSGNVTSWTWTGAMQAVDVVPWWSGGATIPFQFRVYAIKGGLDSNPLIQDGYLQ